MSQLSGYCSKCGTLNSENTGCNCPDKQLVASLDQLNDAGEDTTMTVDETLKQRGSRYGTFKNHANLSVTLRSTLFQHYSGTHPEGPALTPTQIEAMTMICHKLARIVNGDPSYDDSWKDIAGYAELVVKELQGIEI